MKFYIERHPISLPPDVVYLINSSYEELERKEFFAFDPATDGKDLLALDGYLYEAREEESKELAAIIFLSFPHKDNPIARDLKMSDDDLGQLKVAVTKKEYRGHGLMKALMDRAEQDAKDLKIKYLSATVHPENRASRGNMVKNGFSVALNKEMYGGLNRDIMLKKLT